MARHPRRGKTGPQLMSKLGNLDDTVNSYDAGCIPRPACIYTA